MEAPALKRAKSMPAKEFSRSSSMTMGCPRKERERPADLAEARRERFWTGNWRFSRVLIISRPTAPEAPTMATFNFLLI
jgi:hypothetical protein